MYTYSRFYIIFNRSLKLLSLGTHRFGLPTKDMPLFQTHSRGNCDESSETRIFPSTTNWSVIWSHSFPLRFWKILKFSQASWRQKKTQRLHPCLFRVPTTSSAWCYFFDVFLPVFFQALFNKKSLMDFGISRNMSTNAAAGCIASRRAFFWGGLRVDLKTGSCQLLRFSWKKSQTTNRDI